MILNFLDYHDSRWYAKRFLHPDIVAAYEYIFIWDEDLGVDHFNGDEYVVDLHLTISSYIFLRWLANMIYIAGTLNLSRNIS